jgi:SAM-dependent methyltransferase
MASSKLFYEDAYAKCGLASQRRYPNEELCRFMGHHYFSLSRDKRKDIRILEVGCGTGANLWMIAREGFDAHGIDFSADAIRLCRAELASYGVSAHLAVGDMTSLPFADGQFDAVVDVFSAFCLTGDEFSNYLCEVSRTLNPGGRYFSYMPSKRSDAFIDFVPSKKLDPNTLDGIRREGAAYEGIHIPFRFTTGDEYADALKRSGLCVLYNETVGRTYHGGKEYFEFVVVTASKPPRASAVGL